MELLFLQKASLAPEQQMNVMAAASEAQKYIFYAATATSPILNGIFSNNKLIGI